MSTVWLCPHCERWLLQTAFNEHQELYLYKEMFLWKRETHVSVAKDAWYYRSFCSFKVGCHFPNYGIESSLKCTRTVAVPTGLAAFKVGGGTIHRLLQLPVEHERNTAGYSKESQRIMCTILWDMKLHIVDDEVLMLSNLNLTDMH